MFNPIRENETTCFVFPCGLRSCKFAFLANWKIFLIETGRVCIFFCDLIVRAWMRNARHNCVAEMIHEENECGARSLGRTKNN